MATINLIPAYGRDYKSKTEVFEAWTGGKDFQVADVSSPYNGAYTSIRDFSTGDRITIRYKKLANVAVIQIK